MGDLSASADIRGHAIDLALAWSDPSTRARSLRILRRRSGYPTNPGDGLLILDLAELFTVAGAPWARIEKKRYLLVNAPAEGGLLQAEIASYYQAAGDPHPTRVRIVVHDGVAGVLGTTVIDGVTLVTSTGTTSATFAAITTFQIFAPTWVGSVVVSRQAVDGVSPDLFEWTAAGAPTIRASFVLQEEQRTAATLRALVPLDVAFVTSVVLTDSPDVPVRTVDFTEALNPDTGDLGRSIAISDRDPPARAAHGFVPGLHPGVAYYYAAWEDPGTGFLTDPDWKAFSVATGNHGFADRLFAMLPSVHRYYDDPASGPQPGTGQPGSWQLRRFLQVVGPALDQAFGLGEALRKLKDIFEVRADYLPRLGRWIGWEVDRTLPTRRQRDELLFAPDVFATTGTVPNIQALVHRSTGWGCQVKEFANNVFLTNAVESIRLWEIWQAPAAIGVLTLPVDPTQVTRAVNDSIDARPAVAAEPSGGSPWLFWHSKRADAMQAPLSARRQIWMRRLDGSGPARPVMQGAPDAGRNLTFSDEWPAAIADGSVVRLFWSSNRGGSAGIWTRTLTAGAPSDATQLTKHAAGDHCPAVVKDAGGAVWLFWHSRRRGPTDIWAMTLAPGATSWSAPRRITSGQPRDQMPAAFVDASSQLRLVWSAGLADRSRIVQSTFNGTSWSEPTHVSSGGDTSSSFRDEAPAVVLFNGDVWAFWSSNRDGLFRLWASRQTGAGWSAPVPVTTGRHGEKDPAAFVDDSGGALRLLFRSQQGGEAFRSRTVDFANLAAIRRGRVDDRWHYTYSVAIDSASCYARDTVGLFITPDNATNLAEADRVRTLVEPFRPLPVRFVWFLEPAAFTETVYSPIDIGESYHDDYPYVDTLGAVGESTTVALPQWSILHTNTPGDVAADPADLTTLRHRIFYPAPT
jgi:hypothetical protein